MLRRLLPLESIYTVPTATQAKYFTTDLKTAILAVKDRSFSKLPNYYGGPVQPNPPVSVNKTTGCES